MSVVDHDIFRVLEIDHSQFLEPPLLHDYEEPTDAYIECCENSSILSNTDYCQCVQSGAKDFERRYCSFYGREIWAYRELNRSTCEKCDLCRLNCTQNHTSCGYNQLCSECYTNEHRCSNVDCNPVIYEDHLEYDDFVNSRPEEHQKPTFLEDKTYKAAITIKNFLIGIRNKKIFRNLKSTIRGLSKKDPVKLLLISNYVHALIFDRSSCILIFRLDGTTFPPKIVYKIFTNQKILLVEPHECILKRKCEVKKPSLYTWSPFSVYKCEICKSKVRIRPKICKRSKKKWREDNHISWIEEMYG